MTSPLISWPRDERSYLPSRTSRRPMGPNDPETVAMHWDGTYRDRIVGRTDRRFWPELANSRPRPAWTVAKHLAAVDQS